MIKMLSILGTRPEAIKMAPVIRRLAECRSQVNSLVCVTGQHRQMLDQMLGLFAIQPDYDLHLMRRDQSLAQLTAAIIRGLAPILEAEKPDWVLVQGDTTTVLSAALVAFYHKIRIGHVEAGLRSHDKWRPFPEEINRKVADLVADLLFAPTERARANLLAEGVPNERIRVTGNTGIDALLWAAAQPYCWERGPLRAVPRDRRLILVTAHRRESLGSGLREFCSAIRDLALARADDCRFVYLVHLNPKVQATVHEILEGIPNVSLLDAVDYLSSVHLMRESVLVLTDSGGIQEEAPSLGVPVLVARETTERAEAIEAGVARLVGTDRQNIIEQASRLLDDAEAYERCARVVHLYGDGHAAERIVTELLES